MLAEHFHHAPGGGEEFVVWHGRGVPLAVGRFEDSLQAVGKGLVGAKDPEISLFIVQLRNVAQESSEHMGVADAAATPARARRAA